MHVVIYACKSFHCEINKLNLILLKVDSKSLTGLSVAKIFYFLSPLGNQLFSVTTRSTVASFHFSECPFIYCWAIFIAVNCYYC